MKHIKKMITLLLAAVMVLAMSSVAFADTNSQTLDNKISVSGLEAGDTVDFYQVLKYDQNASSTGGWAAATGFTLTPAEIQKILKIGDYATGGSKASEAGIDATLAATIADQAEEASAKYPNISAASGVAEKASPDAGLYLALVTPGKAGFVYNPIFVGADYMANTTNTHAVTLTDSYEPASMAKKSEITLDKTAEDASTVDNNKSETVSVGDEITFTVKTTIPEFADNYTNPVFNVSDVLSTGLKLNKTSIKVYPTHDAITDSTDEIAAANYTTNDPAMTDNTYTVKFTANYLKGLTAAQPITIQYKATVTSDAATNVNLVDNKVTVNYSNNPTDNEGHGVLKDITNHYTFDIDANLFGGGTGKQTEVIKVGLDENGKEITETVTLDNGKTAGALQGAEFELYTDQACTKKYTNTMLTSDSKIVSDASGYLTIQGQTTPGIRGLDAGTYYLKETKAPDGYIAAQDPVKIEIIPTFTEKTYKETIEGKEVTYKAQELASYVIEINDVQTASYTFKNDAVNTNALDPDEEHDDVIGAAGLIGAEGAGQGAAAGKIQNTKGVALPSTGGIGTIIFYVLGSILVIGCGIVLVSKRRMSKER